MSCRYGMYDHLVTSQYYCDLTGDFCVYDVPNVKKCKEEYADCGFEAAIQEVGNEQ